VVGPEVANCHRIATGGFLVCAPVVLRRVLIGQHLSECPLDHVSRPVVCVAEQVAVDAKSDRWQAVPEAARDCQYIHALGDELRGMGVTQPFCLL